METYAVLEFIFILGSEWHQVRLRNHASPPAFARQHSEMCGGLL